MQSQKTNSAAPAFYQVGAERFERRDPLPQVPFAFDDAESLPALPEAIAWIFLGGMFVFLCLLLMGVA